LFNIFKKSSASLINDVQTKAYAAWGIKDNDIALKIRFRAGLGFYLAAIMYDNAGGKNDGISSLVLSKLIESVENDICTVSSVFSVSKTVRCVSFSEEIFRLKVGLPKTGGSMNGRAFLTEIGDCFGLDVMNYILERKDTVLGLPGAGVLAVKDLTLGKMDYVGDNSALAKDFIMLGSQILQSLKREVLIQQIKKHNLGD
jgi:hypothetical protein